MEDIDVIDRPFPSFTVGETASFVREITPEDVAAFAALSGDRNPLHVDESYAAAAGYERRIAHGLLVAAPISTLAGHFLPGRRCLLLEVSSRLLRPVFPPDQLTYRGTIIQVSPAARVLKVKVDVTNQAGIPVLTGAYIGRVLQTRGDEDRT